jgi:phage FluMu protein Com
MAPPPRGALVLGETYFTVKCPKCSGIIPIAPNPKRSKKMSGQGKINVGCPFCGEATEHPTSAVKTRLLKVLPPEAN